MSDPKHPSPEEYAEAADSLHILAGIMLFEFARDGNGSRDRICRDFVARADTLVASIFRLWEVKHYGDCWILHRTLLDRLFHLHELNEQDQFDSFDNWSFKMQYEAINRVRSDPDMAGRLDGVVENATAEQKERYRGLSKNPPIWCRPKAEDVAKTMGVSFLYKYGYDFASTHVHPMANDGNQDFYRITRLEPAPSFPDWAVVLNNSLLVASMTLQEAINASTLSWQQLVYDSLDGIREFLGDASPEYLEPTTRAASRFANKVHLSEPRKDQSAS